MTIGTEPIWAENESLFRAYRSENWWESVIRVKYEKRLWRLCLCLWKRGALKSSKISNEGVCMSTPPPLTSSNLLARIPMRNTSSGSAVCWSALLIVTTHIVRFVTVIRVENFAKDKGVNFLRNNVLLTLAVFFV